MQQLSARFNPQSTKPNGALMNKILVGLSLLALVESVSAHPQRYPFSVTGHGLIEQFYGPETSRGKPRTSIDYQRYEIARGYISGVKDTSEGTAWCHVPKLKPDEVDSELVSALMKLPPDILKGTAAPLLVAALKERFPCPARRVK